VAAVDIGRQWDTLVPLHYFYGRREPDLVLEVDSINKIGKLIIA
jgi:hypothetical protein